MRKRWEVFERFLESGAIRLDNNCTEAALKGPVMGKKAWLFFGNEQGGETAAALFTLMMTCKRQWNGDGLEAVFLGDGHRIPDCIPNRPLRRPPQHVDPSDVDDAFERQLARRSGLLPPRALHRACEVP